MSIYNNKLPIVRPRKEEIEACIALLVSASALLQREDDIKNRLKMIPNGYRDFKCAVSIMNKLSEKIIKTFTPEKVRTINAMIPDLRYSIRYHKRAGRQEEGFSGIFTSDLDLLCSVCIEYCCKMCDGQCDRCDLAKVFDSMLESNREQGESYSFIDMKLPGFNKRIMNGN